MKNFAAFILLLWGTTTLSAMARDVTFFIAENGKDTATGTLEAPFATYCRAMTAVKEEYAAGDLEHATIYFRGGRYDAEKDRFQYKLDFSGLKTPLLISNWKDEHVTLLGGISLVGWKDEGNGRFSAPIPTSVKDPATLRTLFLNDAGMTWARWPNFEPRYPYSGGWAYVAGEPFNMYTDVPDEKTNVIVMNEAKSWKYPERGEVLIFPRHNWSNDIRKIVSIDSKTKTLTADRSFRYAARPRDRYCVFGMPEELDAPGEWVADFENRRILFIPPVGTTLETLEKKTTLGTLQNILSFGKCRNITIHGLTLVAGNGNGMQIHACSDITVEKCVLHDVGFRNGNGIDAYQCDRLTVYGNDIYNTGAQGVSIHGGDVYALRSSGNVVENNYVHHTGRYLKGGGAFSIGGCGNRIAYNLGHDFPRGPISVTGVRNLIEYNHFHHANMESEDTGLIYMNGAGSWINGRDSTIRYNHFSDNIGFGHKNGVYQFYMFSWGIYLDDTTADVEVYGNWVERCTIGCVHLHNARENEIFNNLFVDGGQQQFQMSGWTNNPNARMMKRHINDMTQNYEKAIQNPEWRTLRDMQVPPQETFLPDGTSMRGNHIFRNIFYWPNQPESEYVKTNDNVNFDYNEFSQNLLWNGGKSIPLAVAKSRVRRIEKDWTNTLPNVTFAKVGEKNMPEGWNFFMNCVPNMEGGVSEPGTLKLVAKYNPEKQYVKNAVLRSAQFPLPLGKDYRLTCKIRRTGTDAEATLRVLADGKGLWLPLGGAVAKQDGKGEFQECSALFHIPKEGEPKYDERIDTFSLLFSIQGGQGFAEVKDIRLEEVEIAQGWDAWQMMKQDKGSVFADPKFVDAAHGDYRLREDSPALKMGFEPLPFDKMGPYADPRRASWPIQEADGVKNHPEWLEIPTR